MPSDDSILDWRNQVGRKQIGVEEGSTCIAGREQWGEATFGIGTRNRRALTYQASLCDDNHLSVNSRLFVVDVPKEQTILLLAMIPPQKVANLEAANTCSNDSDKSRFLYVNRVSYLDRFDARNANDDLAFQAHTLSMP